MSEFERDLVGPETRPALVFVHGGSHTAQCWNSTIRAVARLDGEVQMLAVNLPGRGDEPGDLGTLTIAQCAQSVVDQIDRAGLDSVVLVGHSLAGITLPGVAAALGPGRVRSMVYLACAVPPQGQSVLSTLKPPSSWIAGLMSKFQKVSKPMPAPLAKRMFANGMTDELQNEVVAGLVPESAVIRNEPVDRSGTPELPTTWILTLRDRALPPDLQHDFIANLGTVGEVIEMDTCHNAMMSEPDRLAEILLGHC